MNNEHNIDDILKLLKESVERDSEKEDPKTPEGKRSTNISEKKLKQQLKQQYGTDALADAERTGSDDEYVFDRALLLEFEATEKEESEKELVSEKAPEESFVEDPTAEEPSEIEKECSDEELSDCAPWEDPAEKIIEEHEEEPEEELEEEFEEEPIEEFAEESEEESEEEFEAELMEELAEEPTEASEEEDGLDWDSLVKTELISEPELSLHEDMKAVETEPTAELGMDQEELYEEFPEIETIAMPELTQDFSSGEPTNESEDLSALLSEETAKEEELVSDASTAEFCVNESIFDLMLQFGCQDELDEISEEAVTEEFAEEEPSEDENEYRSSEQDGEILADYRRSSIRALARLIALGLMAVVAFLYDTLPLLHVEFKGLIDYHTYYGSYLLIGLQFVLIAAVCLGRRLWNGFKRLFSIRPDFYSMIAVTVIYTAAYDAVMVIAPTEGSQPPTFHFVCVVWMLLATCAEMVLLRRERKLFLIFSAQAPKYTAEINGGAHSVAEKMYRGGIDETKRIFAPASVSFPSGFFRSVRGENHMSNRMIPWILFPAVLLSLVAGMVTMLLKEDLAVVCLSVLVTLLVLLPCAAIAIPIVTLGISSARLTGRGIALTGNGAISSYSDVDFFVFNDLHLFKKCETKDTGMVIYEQRQAAELFGCLQLLYSKIGGPMAKAFENVPQDYRFDRIYVRRITRNGIEAIVEKKHVLILGDAGYMQRYGLSFPMNEEWDGRATLCVSLDGKVSAKISAAYEIEPIFEMLIERMAQNGIRCVIETFDPMIHSAFVLEKRRLGVTPISVVHKNAEDLRRNGRRKARAAETGIVTLSSRLKLAEAAVWCKRLVKLFRYNNILIAAFSVLGAVMAGLAVGFGWMPFVNQYWLMLLQLLPFLGIGIAALFGFPKKDYFSLESLNAELIYAAEKMERKKQRKANKGSKKRS